MIAIVSVIPMDDDHNLIMDSLNHPLLLPVNLVDKMTPNFRLKPNPPLNIFPQLLTKIDLDHN